MKLTKLLDTSTLSDDEIQTAWEEAYERFETQEEEIQKFVKRLEFVGQKDWKRDAQTVELFCGRCNGIRALEKLGFTNLEGVDISRNLLTNYRGKAKLYQSDCRILPFADKSRDIIILQGGLHHLPRFPDDVEQTLSEIHRVLRPAGHFVLIEPWLTLFLRLIHFLSERNFIRKISNKFDAFAAMTHYEKETYYRWLGQQSEILLLLKKYFTAIRLSKKFGKIIFIGKRK
ncbi:MAG: class I SAM-dependent methyltransferase [Acidobacteria bacterium]|nr:class I SAM-dependent methyltransferase [Acidobacteriota bacterium]MCA1637662.1 class I SAM-dependent methyltransferase [Acidobacteriota bacterium]